MKILICTGIFPPNVGGPAQYAKEVSLELKRHGHSVKVLAFELERKLPTIIRHELFFWRTLFSLRGVDFILALDTFSVGFPAAVDAKILRKKIIIRTGGDFLWESYVERTGDLVLFRDFYKSRLDKLNFKERIIFDVTRWTLKNSKAIIFSTEWQRRFFEEAYNLNPHKNFIVENFYGEKLESLVPDKKIFVGGTRPLKWKNLPRLAAAFELARREDPSISLDLLGAPYEEFLKKIQNSYAVILVSLGDISPNMILDAVRSQKPFILSRENGLYDRIKDIGLFVDPEDKKDIYEKILMLSKKEIYDEYKNKISQFNFTHSWREICDEIISIASKN